MPTVIAAKLPRPSVPLERMSPVQLEELRCAVNRFGLQLTSFDWVHPSNCAKILRRDLNRRLKALNKQGRLA